MPERSEKMRKDKEMSCIHPAYLENTRLRVAAIRKFLAGDRSKASLVETADAIGLSTSRTGRLIRSYELHQDPELISGDGRRQSRSASTEKRDMVRQIIDAAISDQGTTAEARDIERAVISACDQAAIARPSTQLIWKTLSKARRANREPAVNVSPRILVGRVWFQLPVELQDGSIERPEALIALKLPDKSIRACITNLHRGSKPRLVEILAALNEVVDVHATGIELGRIDTASFPFNTVSDDSAQNEFIRHLGNGIGELDVLFRRPRTDATNLLSQMFAKPMSVKAAHDAIEMAIARNEREVAESAERSKQDRQPLPTSSRSTSGSGDRSQHT